MEDNIEDLIILKYDILEVIRQYVNDNKLISNVSEEDIIEMGDVIFSEVTWVNPVEMKQLIIKEINYINKKVSFKFIRLNGDEYTSVLMKY